MIDITERVNPHLRPFFMDWENYKLHLEVTQVLESPIRGFWVYKLSGFATLIDETQDNENIPPIEDILLSDSLNGKAIDAIDNNLYQVIFKLLGCNERALCGNTTSGNHNIDDEVSIDNFV